MMTREGRNPLLARLLPTCFALGVAATTTTGQVVALQAPASVVTETTLTVGELEFDALSAGPEDGPLVVLLHGFPQTSHAFRGIMPTLASHGYRVIAPNQRGYSPRARPEDVDAYQMDRLVGDVVAMAGSLGYQKFSIVGHDWGAVVAWFTALSRPDLVESIAAISIAHPLAYAEALRDPDGAQAGASGYMEMFAAPGSETQFLANDAALLRSILAGVEDAPVYLRALGTPEALRAALNWYRAMGSNQLGPLTPIHMPALYIWGSADVTMSRTGAEATARYVFGPYRFLELPGVGHWVLSEAEDEVTQALARHLVSASGARTEPGR